MKKEIQPADPIATITCDLTEIHNFWNAQGAKCPLTPESCAETLLHHFSAPTDTQNPSQPTIPPTGRTRPRIKETSADQPILTARCTRLSHPAPDVALAINYQSTLTRAENRHIALLQKNVQIGTTF